MEEQKHQRRVRYSGTHPRKFEEKYKEHQPEKYADTIEHILAKGNTPAGMHIPIMVKEILDFLQIQPGQNGLDATLGYGGHSSRMLEELKGSGHLTALDIDPIESAKTEARLRSMGYDERILTVRLQNFADLDRAVQAEGPFDFILADLGVSSMQIDNPERGFSFREDGPLDMRMNPLKGESAAERLKKVTMEELQGMLEENSDEPYAERIARAVKTKLKKGKPIETTAQLKGVIEEALFFIKGPERKEEIRKSCQRTFQALRIDVNSEFEVLYAFLSKLPSALKPGGKAAILTFHSGEDRMVKKAFKDGEKDGIYAAVSQDVIRPTAEECRRNPRAHSTKMRWCIRQN